MDETDNQADTAVPPVATEEQWKQFQAAADQAEKLLHEKTELTRQLELLKNKEDKPYNILVLGRTCTDGGGGGRTHSLLYGAFRL